jgi:hypothetical protein
VRCRISVISGIVHHAGKCLSFGGKADIGIAALTLQIRKRSARLTIFAGFASFARRYARFPGGKIMAATINPAAPHALPMFITAPGETDAFLVFMGLFLVAAVLGFGILFLRLHTLPERMAHRSQKLQFEIVAVLGLLALFTHIHLFWVAGLNPRND